MVWKQIILEKRIIGPVFIEDANKIVTDIEEADKDDCYFQPNKATSQTCHNI